MAIFCYILEDVCRASASYTFSEVEIGQTIINMSNIRNIAQRDLKVQAMPGLEDPDHEKTVQGFAESAGVVSISCICKLFS